MFTSPLNVMYVSEKLYTFYSNIKYVKLWEVLYDWKVVAARTAERQMHEGQLWSQRLTSVTLGVRFLCLVLVFCNFVILSSKMITLITYSP